MKQEGPMASYRLRQIHGPQPRSPSNRRRLLGNGQIEQDDRAIEQRSQQASQQRYPPRAVTSALAQATYQDGSQQGTGGHTQGQA